MKKILMLTMLLMLYAFNVLAAPTVTVSVYEDPGPYVIFKIVYTSDGTDAAAVDLISLMDQYTLSFVKDGVTAMILSSVPGAGGVAPDNSVDVIFTDSTGLAVFTSTGNAVLSTGPVLKHDLSTDMGQYPFITLKGFSMTLEDVGTAGDQYTFYLRGWVEKLGKR